MKSSNSQKLRAWEIALLCALCVTLGVGLWAESAERTLSNEIIRLHVIAESDAPEAQAEKLQMRDHVLALLAPLLADCRTREEAAAIIEAHTADIEALGDVSVALAREYYPTRRYSTFSLPAGEYLSLRVTMGDGLGHNWWCVVFPPLCTEVLAETGTEEAFSALDPVSAGLIPGDGNSYDLRFRVVDWWGQLREALR